MTVVHEGADHLLHVYLVVIHPDGREREEIEYDEEPN